MINSLFSTLAMTKKSLTLFFLLSFILPSGFLFAQGDLMILPKRLIFENGVRSQEINLANTGRDTTTYAISLIQYKMTESGDFKEISTPEEGQRFASDFLRYYPRRVTLAPNEAQTIRVQLTNTANLRDGEYRSHFYFHSIDKPTELENQDSDKQATGISINIKAVFGISIPVIIREGKSTVQLTLSNIGIKEEEGKKILSVQLNRTGNMSLYGDLTISYLSPAGQEQIIAKVKGLAVYTPNTTRTFQVKLPDKMVTTSGKLKINYSTEKEGVLAATTFNLDH